MTALKPYSCTPILTWLAKDRSAFSKLKLPGLVFGNAVHVDCALWQAGGAQVGENVQIHWRGFQGCPELDMITLGDDVYIGRDSWPTHYLDASF